MTIANYHTSKERLEALYIGDAYISDRCFYSSLVVRFGDVTNAPANEQKAKFQHGARRLRFGR